ncbi:MAG: hypothetical protein ACYCVB_07210 [Bacilli bacterium]
MSFRNLKDPLDLERLFMQIPAWLDTHLYIKDSDVLCVGLSELVCGGTGIRQTTEAKMQEQLSELGLSKQCVEPLGSEKWSVVNDNPMTTFFRTSLSGMRSTVTFSKTSAFCDTSLREVHFRTGSPSQISARDMAHALGNIELYAEHTKRFYSAAQHSVFVAAYLAVREQLVHVQLQGLSQSAAEAYMGDVPRPIKRVSQRLSRPSTNCCA